MPDDQWIHRTDLRSEPRRSRPSHFQAEPRARQFGRPSNAASRRRGGGHTAVAAAT